jgi:ubiquinol-cytochrome c reductase cytochrome c1 subunit
MLRKVLVIAAALAFAGGAPALAAGPYEPREMHWGFEGPFGKFDQEQLQRGYKVFSEVCQNCHSADLMSYRTLGEKGGPFWNPKYPNPNENPVVKAIAAGVTVDDIDPDTGDKITRPGTTADRFKRPFPNEPAARASNGGALPPDLSVITKAREGGPRYVYSILTGYNRAPTGFDMAMLTTPQNKHYNPYYAGDTASAWHMEMKDETKKPPAPGGGFISMPPPLADNKVTYDDGVKATVDQEAKDVVAFLAWASEPKQVERKQTGFAVMIYLLILTGLAYASYRRVWRNESH